MPAQTQTMQKIELRPTVIRNLEKEFDSISGIVWPVNDIDWDDAIEEINSLAIQYNLKDQIEIDPFEDEIKAMRQFKMTKAKVLRKIQLLIVENTPKEIENMRAAFGGMVIQEDDVGGI